MYSIIKYSINIYYLGRTFHLGVNLDIITGKSSEMNPAYAS